MTYHIAFTNDDGTPRKVWLASSAYSKTHTGDRAKRATWTDQDDAELMASDWNDYLSSKGYTDRVTVVTTEEADA